jgi:pyridoxal 5'-phosphate synthase pdxT subunit
VIAYGVGRRRDAILSPEFAGRGGDAVDAPCVGVLALQGDFREHRATLERLGAVTTEVRRPEALEVVDGLVIPGGESTTIGKLMREYGFIEAIRAFAKRGGPVYGSCAGLITLAGAIVEGDQPLLGLIDIVARRNAFGRQRFSFEVELEVPVLGLEPLRAVFIRAPWIESAGPGVDIWASHAGHGVAATQGRVMVTAFHPELTGDTRVHARFLETVAEHRRERRDAAGRGRRPWANEEVAS